MHEMALTSRVVDIVVKHAEIAQTDEVLLVRLRIGEMRDIVEDLMEKCFRFVAKGTVAANASLEIVRIPMVVECKQCGHQMPLKLHSQNTLKTVCPNCNIANFKIIQGNEFYIDDIIVK